MIRHVVAFKMKTGTPDEVFDRISDALLAMPSMVPELVEYQFGRDLGLRDGNADYGVSAVFADGDGLMAYMTNEEHIRVSRELIMPFVENKQGCQIQV